MSQLVTGEAVALDLRPAALPSRLIAAAIDGLAQTVLLFGLFLLLGAGVGAGLSDAAGAAVSIVFFLLVVAGYPILFETLMRGRTPGKAAMGLRVVRDDGGPIAFRQALVRGLASVFLERPGITVFSGAVISSLLNRDSKRLGDLLAGTLVLQERIPGKVTQPVQMPYPLAGWAAELDLSGLPDDLARSARSFLARAPELTDAAREDLGGKLVAAVVAAVQPPPPAGAPGWAVLSAVLAERRRRAELQYAPAGGYGTPPPPPAPPGYAAPVAPPVETSLPPVEPVEAPPAKRTRTTKAPARAARTKAAEAPATTTKAAPTKAAPAKATPAKAAPAKAAPAKAAPATAAPTKAAKAAPTRATKAAPVKAAPAKAAKAAPAKATKAPATRATPKPPADGGFSLPS